MPEKSPETYSLITWLWVIALSAWGGIVHYRAKVIASSPHTWSLYELIGEVCVSAFAGVLTFLACEALGISQLWTAVSCGVAGHMGGHMVTLLEDAVKKRLGLPS